jgi:hypothetical protein
MVVLSGMCVSRLDAHIPRQRQSPSPKPFPTGLCVCVVCLFLPGRRHNKHKFVCVVCVLFLFVSLCRFGSRGARDTRLSLEPKPNLVATHYHHHHHHHHHLFLFWCVVLVCLFVCLCDRLFFVFVCVLVGHNNLWCVGVGLGVVAWNHTRYSERHTC